VLLLPLLLLPLLLLSLLLLMPLLLLLTLLLHCNDGLALHLPVQQGLHCLWQPLQGVPAVHTHQHM
jgi:hypothetical protein